MPRTGGIVTVSGWTDIFFLKKDWKGGMKVCISPDRAIYIYQCTKGGNCDPKRITMNPNTGTQLPKPFRLLKIISVDGRSVEIAFSMSPPGGC